MSIFLITFQTNNSGRQANIVGVIKSQGAWARITASTWCVKSDCSTVSSLRGILSQQLIDEDRLFVVDVSSSDWASYCIPSEVTDWLKV